LDKILRPLKFRKSNNTKSDSELIAEFIASNNNEVIAELFTRYTDMCFLVSMKYLKNETNAEDLTMQVFEKLPKMLREYKIDNFKSWLYTVVKNECLLELRKQQTELRNRKKFEDSDELIMESEQEMYLFNSNENENLNLLKDAVQTLADDQRTCIELFYFEEKSYDEIVEMTGFSGKQVKSFIQNGRRNLQIFMKKHRVSLLFILNFLLRKEFWL